MELIDEDTLETRWNGLTKSKKHKFAADLSSTIRSWRSLKLGSGNSFVGDMSRRQVRDMLFELGRSLPDEPFASVAAFHEHYARISCPPERYARARPEFTGLDDSEDIVFTHGDLHQSNVLISKVRGDEISVVGVIDWHQSGWYSSS